MTEQTDDDRDFEEYHRILDREGTRLIGEAPEGELPTTEEYDAYANRLGNREECDRLWSPIPTLMALLEHITDGHVVFDNDMDAVTSLNDIPAHQGDGQKRVNYGYGSPSLEDDSDGDQRWRTKSAYKRGDASSPLQNFRVLTRLSIEPVTEAEMSELYEMLGVDPRNL